MLQDTDQENEDQTATEPTVQEGSGLWENLRVGRLGSSGQTYEKGIGKSILT